MKEIAADKLKHLIENKDDDFILIDVREEWERTNYSIGGIHIPLGELIIRQLEIPKDKSVVLYCEKGIRSTIAIQRLEALGFHNLYNLTGGLKAWKAAK